MIAQNIVIQKLSFPKKGSMAEWSKGWNVSEGDKKVDQIKQWVVSEFRLI